MAKVASFLEIQNLEECPSPRSSPQMVNMRAMLSSLRIDGDVETASTSSSQHISHPPSPLYPFAHSGPASPCMANLVPGSPRMSPRPPACPPTNRRKSEGYYLPSSGSPRVHAADYLMEAQPSSLIPSPPLTQRVSRVSHASSMQIDLAVDGLEVKGALKDGSWHKLGRTPGMFRSHRLLIVSDSMSEGGSVASQVSSADRNASVNDRRSMDPDEDRRTDELLSRGSHETGRASPADLMKMCGRSKSGKTLRVRPSSVRINNDMDQDLASILNEDCAVVDDNLDLGSPRQSPKQNPPKEQQQHQQQQQQQQGAKKKGSLGWAPELVTQSPIRPQSGRRRSFQQESILKPNRSLVQEDSSLSPRHHPIVSPILSSRGSGKGYDHVLSMLRVANDVDGCTPRRASASDPCLLAQVNNNFELSPSVVNSQASFASQLTACSSGTLSETSQDLPAGGEVIKGMLDDGEKGPTNRQGHA